MRAITSIIKEQNKTLIMVTHDPNIALYADRVVHLLDGKITKISDNHHNNPVKDKGTPEQAVVPEAEELANEA